MTLNDLLIDSCHACGHVVYLIGCAKDWVFVCPNFCEIVVLTSADLGLV